MICNTVLKKQGWQSDISRLRSSRYAFDLNAIFEIQGPFELKPVRRRSLIFPADRTSQQFARTKIIRYYVGVYGFRHDCEGEEGVGEEEEDKQSCRRDELEARGERWRTTEGEGEDVTQAVLGLSALWIWHLEEQRPLTLGCGHTAARVARIVHTYAPRVSAKTYTR